MRPEYTPEFVEKFWQRVDKNGPVPEHAPELGPCWIWTLHPNPKGYGTCGLKGVRDVLDVGTRAHRIAFYIAYGWILPASSGFDIAHKCDRRNCVNPAHLVSMSHVENVADRDAKGRQERGPNAPKFAPIPRVGHRRGEGAARAKLTEADVREIRRRYVKGKRGCGVTALAKEFGVYDFAIELIVKRKSWKHVE